MKKLLSILAAGALLFGGGSLSGLAKKALGHEDFDGWKRARNYGLSRDGRWEAFAAVPQEGDAMLTLYNTATGKRIEIPRGYNPKFTADSRYAVALVEILLLVDFTLAGVGEEGFRPAAGLAGHR